MAYDGRCGTDRSITKERPATFTCDPGSPTSYFDGSLHPVTRMKHVDVDDLDKAVEFHASGIGLHPGRRPFGDTVATGRPCTLISSLTMWAAVQGALNAGAKLEGEVKCDPWGYLGTISDRFGPWVLLQFIGSGYDEVESTAS